MTSSSTLLLFEHEPVIMLHLQDALVAHHYNILTASTYEEALLLCRLHLPEYAILNFQDKLSPDGMHLAKVLRVRFRIKVLIITGVREQDLKKSPEYYAGQSVLFKPYTSLQLLEAIAEI